MWMPVLLVAAALVTAMAMALPQLHIQTEEGKIEPLPSSDEDNTNAGSDNEGGEDPFNTFPVEGTRYKREGDYKGEIQEYSTEDDNQIDLGENDPAADLDSNLARVSKRFLSIFRTRPPKSEGYKRGPGFRSWGGKRSGAGADASKRDSEYIMPFQQSEKRGKNDGTKRRPFQSWGGKRSKLDQTQNYFTNDELKDFRNWEEKRKFSSWGGKRAEPDHFDKRTERKKPSFQSWGGKRSDY